MINALGARRCLQPAGASALAALLLVFVALCGASQADAQTLPQMQGDGGSSSKRVMTVGVHALPPYMIKGGDGSWYGLGVDLLKAVADQLHREYRLVETSPQDMVPDVAGGKLDAAIGAVPINAGDEVLIDFSQPYYSGDLGIALRYVDRIGFSTMIALLTSPALLYMLGLLVGPVFFVGALIWLLERRANPENFEPRPARGVFSGVWWATVTMTTVGYGDKAPLTFLGRVVAMFWMFAALILAAITTAQLAAGLTSSFNSNFVDSIGDLSGLRVGTIAESAAEMELSTLNIATKSFSSVSDGLDALEKNDIDALVYDRAILQWALHDYRALYLDSLHFFERSYGMILPLNDPDSKAINIAILKTLETSQWHLIVERYLPGR